MARRKKETPEYIALRDLALKQLKSGQSLTGEGGIFEPIIKDFIRVPWRPKWMFI